MSTGSSSNNDPKKSLLDWGLERLAFPPPDTFKLVEPETRPRHQGLFHEMMKDNPTELLQYAAGRKGMHEQATLLHELAVGAKSADSLHPEERMQLDALTAEMLTESPVRRKVSKPFEHLRKQAEREDTSYGDAPSPDAFWWL